MGSQFGKLEKKQTPIELTGYENDSYCSGVLNPKEGRISVMQMLFPMTHVRNMEKGELCPLFRSPVAANRETWGLFIWEVTWLSGSLRPGCQSDELTHI